MTYKSIRESKCVKCNKAYLLDKQITDIQKSRIYLHNINKTIAINSNVLLQNNMTLWNKLADCNLHKVIPCGKCFKANMARHQKESALFLDELTYYCVFLRGKDTRSESIKCMCRVIDMCKDISPEYESIIKAASFLPLRENKTK